LLSKIKKIWMCIVPLYWKGLPVGLGIYYVLICHSEEEWNDDEESRKTYLFVLDLSLRSRWQKNLVKKSLPHFVFPFPRDWKSRKSSPIRGRFRRGLEMVRVKFHPYSPLSQAFSSGIVYNSGHGLYVSGLKYTLSLEASTCLLYLNLHNAFFRFSSNSAVQHLPAHFSFNQR